MNGRVAVVAGTACALLASGGTPALANDRVFNDNGSALVVDATYTRDGADGFAYAWQQQGGEGMAFFFEQSGDWVQCAGAKTKTPNDDVYGFVGTFLFGEGPATVTAGARYATGSATATVYAYRDVIDECTGTYTTTPVGEMDLAIGLTTSGGTSTTRDRSRFHIPGELNNHSSFTFTGAWGSGTATVGGDTVAADGFVGTSRWSYHSS